MWRIPALYKLSLLLLLLGRMTLTSFTLPESMTKTTSLMVMLVSAMLVERIWKMTVVTDDTSRRAGDRRVSHMCVNCQGLHAHKNTYTELHTHVLTHACTHA